MSNVINGINSLNISQGLKLSNATITVAYGDGIGPEIMEAVLEIFQAAGAEIKVETINIGQKLYERGYPSGIPDSAWESIKRNKILLKAPITTPQGGGVKSLNVTLRKKLGLYANIRPCTSYAFYSNLPKEERERQKNIDIIIVRENEEDLYAGIEYRQSADTYNSIKVITKSASLRICQYAFEYALRNNRKKVTVMIKDNIMKLTDGIFHQAFKEIAAQYPEIENNSYIIDIGAARIAKYPESFDVIVAPNLYGDIISDIAAEITGSVGLAGSANIGEEYAMFEAVHGSAPDIAGKNIANPSGLLNAAIYMLGFIGQPECASKIYNAWLRTLKKGIHTADIFNPLYSKQKVGTKEFTEHIIDNLYNYNSNKHEDNNNYEGSFQNSSYLPVQLFNKFDFQPSAEEKPIIEKKLLGVDLFINWLSQDIESLLLKLEKLELTNNFVLASISVKGIAIWPEKPLVSTASDTLCCRLLIKEEGLLLAHKDINHLLIELDKLEVEVLKMEKLYVFGQKLGFAN